MDAATPEAGCDLSHHVWVSRVVSELGCCDNALYDVGLNCGNGSEQNRI